MGRNYAGKPDPNTYRKKIKHVLEGKKRTFHADLGGSLFSQPIKSFAHGFGRANLSFGPNDRRAVAVLIGSTLPAQNEVFTNGRV